MVVKIFLVPFNFLDMPINTKTFLRQKFYSGKTIRDAIYLKFYCKRKENGKRQIYVETGMRVVFSSRCVEKSNSPTIRMVTDSPTLDYFAL